MIIYHSEKLVVSLMKQYQVFNQSHYKITVYNRAMFIVLEEYVQGPALQPSELTGPKSMG